MIIAVIDFETTGLDVNKCEIIELACCLYDWENKKLLKQYDALIKPTAPISDEIIQITGITNEMLEEHGKHPGIVFGELAEFLFKDKDLFREDKKPIINFFAAHNGKNFDEIIFRRYINGISALSFMANYAWIDSANDLPFPKHITCKKLTHLCYEYKYIMTNAHRAIFDCYGVVHLLSEFPCKETIKYILMPSVKITAVVKPPWLDDGMQTQIAKNAGFRFDNNTKLWSRLVKEEYLEDFKKSFPLSVVCEQMEMMI